MWNVDFRGLFKIWSFWGCLPPQFRLTVKSFWPKPENFLSLLVLSRWLVIIFFAKMSQKCEIRKFSFMFFFQILIIQAYSDPSLGSWRSQRLDLWMGYRTLRVHSPNKWVNMLHNVNKSVLRIIIICFNKVFTVPSCSRPRLKPPTAPTNKPLSPTNKPLSRNWTERVCFAEQKSFQNKLKRTVRTSQIGKWNQSTLLKGYKNNKISRCRNNRIFISK